MSAPALGIAYDVLNEIDSVTGLAAAAGLKKGQKLAKVKFWQRGPRKSETEEGLPKEITLPLGADKRHWPGIFFAILQDRLAPDKKVELQVEGESTPYELAPMQRSDWFRDERGVRLLPLTDVRV